MNWKNLTKKSQIQFGETMMIVIVLMVLVIVLLVFFSKASYTSSVKEIEYSRDIDAIKLSKYATSLPEISCDELNKDAYCVDELKMNALSDILVDTSNVNQREYYTKFFGYSTIELNKKSIESNADWVILYNNTPVIDQNSNLRTITTYRFITLMNPITDAQEFTTMKITRYILE